MRWRVGGVNNLPQGDASIGTACYPRCTTRPMDYVVLGVNLLVVVGFVVVQNVEILY